MAVVRFMGPSRMRDTDIVGRTPGAALALSQSGDTAS